MTSSRMAPSSIHQDLNQPVAALFDNRRVFRRRSVVTDPSAGVIVGRLQLDGGETGHGKCHDHVDFVALLELSSRQPRDSTATAREIASRIASSS